MSNDLFDTLQEIATEVLMEADMLLTVERNEDIYDPATFAKFMAIMMCEYLSVRTEDEKLTEDDRRSIQCGIMQAINVLYDAYEEDLK